MTCFYKAHLVETLPASTTGKVLHFPGKIFKVLDGQPIVPCLIEVHPSQLCNQACPHCVGWEGGKTQADARMAFEEFRDRIHDPYERLQWPGEEMSRRLSFSGETGDPLVNNDFFRMVEYCRIPFILITNAFRRPDPVLLKAEGIRISLDAVDGETYARRHGVSGAGAFDKVLSHARLLVEWKRMQGAAASIGFGYLTGPETTLEELRRAVAIAEDTGVEYINFRPFHGDTNALTAERATLAAAPRRVQVVFADKYAQIASRQSPQQAHCYATRFLLVVAADWRVYNCCHFTGRTEYQLGSLADSSLEDVLRENARQAARYPNANCPPWCRGHRINADIEGLRNLAAFDPYL